MGLEGHWRRRNGVDPCIFASQNTICPPRHGCGPHPLLHAVRMEVWSGWILWFLLFCSFGRVLDLSKAFLGHVIVLHDLVTYHKCISKYIMIDLSINIVYEVCITYECRVLTSISRIWACVSCVCNVWISMISMNVYNKYDDKYIHFITNQVSVTTVTNERRLRIQRVPKNRITIRACYK